MTTATATAWAVMRRDDATARAIFADADDATAFVQRLNDKVPFAEAFTKLGSLWAAYPWTVPADIFDTEE